MNFTTYYQLKKPLGMEKYDIEVHNANSDILDSELKRLNQKTGELEASWNIAKSHAESVHARADATKTEASKVNGSIKINGMETTVYTHPSGTNPHGTTKEDLGLGETENKSSAAIRSELTKENITAALGYTPYTPAELSDRYATKEEMIALSDLIGQANTQLESI